MPSFQLPCLELLERKKKIKIKSFFLKVQNLKSIKLQYFKIVYKKMKNKNNDCTRIDK